MTNSLKNNKLGRGLSSLFSHSNYPQIIEDHTKNFYTESISFIPLSLIVGNTSQPRKRFDEKELQKLTSSIKEKGVIQPILVRKIYNDDAHKYEIIAGERRFRASKMANLDTIPSIIKNVNDQNTIELSIIENIQRNELSPIEEAVGYKMLVDKFNYTQEKIAEKVGLSRSHITNLIRILSLPPEVQDMLDKNLISLGHAKIIVGMSDPIGIANRIIDNSLSVRDLEVIKKDNKKNYNVKINDNNINKEIDNVVSLIKQEIDVKNSYNTSKLRGKFTFVYKDLEDLKKIINIASKIINDTI